MRAPARAHGADAAVARGEIERERPALAEAERADARALAGRAAEQALDGGVERFPRARRIELLGERAGCAGPVAGPADPVRSERHEALARESIADVEGELAEAIRLVHDQHPRPWPAAGSAT